MSFCVEHPLIQRQNIVVAEDQKQVLEEFCEQERLLHIVLLRTRVVDVADSGIADGALAVLLQVLHVVPCPLSVFFVFCGSPQIEPCLNDFGAQNIVGILTTFRLCFHTRCELE